MLIASSTFAQEVHFSREEHLDAIDAALNLRGFAGRDAEDLGTGRERTAPAIADARVGRTR